MNNQNLNRTCAPGFRSGLNTAQGITADPGQLEQARIFFSVSPARKNGTLCYVLVETEFTKKTLHEQTCLRTVH